MSAPEQSSPGWLRRWLGAPDAGPERAALPVLLLAAGGLAWRGRELPLAVRTALAAAAAAALAVLLRRGWAFLVGPMFFYDLLCSARRGRYILLRCIYALVLLGVIFGIYTSWFGARMRGRPLRADELAEFATSFFTTFLATQMIAVLLLTPAFTAGAIADEKQLRRMDFLLATDLGNHEIVLGKLVSRLATVGLLLLTGLPVLGLMQFLGGVDPNLVLAGFAATLATMLSVASIAMLASAVCEKSSNAMWITYLVAIGYLGMCWCPPFINLGHPLVVYHNLGNALRAQEDLEQVLWKQLLGYIGFHVFVSSIAVIWATLSVRPQVSRPVFAPRLPAPVVLPEPDDAPAIPLAKPVAVADMLSRYPPPVRRPRPPIGDRPLLWKEMHLDVDKSSDLVKTSLAAAGLLLVFIVSMSCLVIILDALGRGKPLGETTNGIVRFLGTTLGCLTLLAILFHSVGTVSLEREQQTLDSLLTMPVERDQILGAKWLGSILSVRMLAWGLGGLWLFGVATGGVHYLALPLLVLSWAAYAAFVASLGLWFSIVSATKVQATVRGLVVLFVIMVGSLIPGGTLALTTPMMSFGMVAFSPHDAVVVGPEMAEMAMRYPWHRDRGTEPRELMTCLAGMAFYAMMAFVLWKFCCERFRAEKGEVSRSEGSEAR